MTESGRFEEGARACLTLAGLGKLSPNMLLLGFKADWTADLESANQYFNVLQVDQSYLKICLQLPSYH